MSTGRHMDEFDLQSEQDSDEIITSPFAEDGTQKKVMKNIIVQASSAGFNGGNFAAITINDEPIKVAKNCHNTLRGLHIVIINGINGNVIRG